MRIYSHQYVGSLISEAKQMLISEGFDRLALPDWEIENADWINGDPGRVRLAPRHQFDDDFTRQHWPYGVGSDGYHRADLYLTTTDANTVRSSFRPNRPGNGYGFEYAATYNQWGIMLGAILDVIPDNYFAEVGHGREPIYSAVRFTGAYDPWYKGRLRNAALDNSYEMFHYITAGRFTKAVREAMGMELLACRQHKWERNGYDCLTCSKCDMVQRRVGYPR